MSSEKLNLVELQVMLVAKSRCINTNPVLSNIGNSSFQFNDDKKKPADVIRERYKSYLENSKQRKRRLWKEKLESRGQTKKKTDTFTDWMYLPDLVLEHIFKYLSYRVSTAVPVDQSLVMMMIMTK